MSLFFFLLEIAREYFLFIQTSYETEHILFSPKDLKPDEEKTEEKTEERVPMTSGQQEDNNTQIYTAPVLQNITFTVRKVGHCIKDIDFLKLIVGELYAPN